MFPSSLFLYTYVDTLCVLLDLVFSILFVNSILCNDLIIFSWHVNGLNHFYT